MTSNYRYFGLDPKDKNFSFAESLVNCIAAAMESKANADDPDDIDKLESMTKDYMLSKGLEKAPLSQVVKEKIKDKNEIIDNLLSEIHRLNNLTLLFTIGGSHYEDLFAEKGSFKKKGRDEGYDGGIIFRSAEEAEKYKSQNGYDKFNIYGVIAHPEKDIEWKADMTGSLLRDSKVVKIK